MLKLVAMTTTAINYDPCESHLISHFKKIEETSLLVNKSSDEASSILETYFSKITGIVSPKVISAPVHSNISFTWTKIKRYWQFPQQLNQRQVCSASDVTLGKGVLCPCLKWSNAPSGAFYAQNKIMHMQAWAPPKPGCSRFFLVCIQRRYPTC